MIDAGLRSSWPVEALEGVRNFRQGDLIGRPPFFFYRNNQYPIWWPGQQEDRTGRGITHLPASACPPYGIITSQTCDVAEEGDHPNWPWIQMAPVYSLDGQPADVERQLDLLHFVHLDGVDLPEGTWVADLRIEFPVEKGELVGRTPIRGFADTGGAEHFGRLLGRQRERPAVATELIRTLGETFNRKRNNNRGKWRRLRDELVPGGLRFQITGERLKPVAAQVHVVGNDEPSDELKEWVRGWFDRALPRLREREIMLLEPQFHRGSCMDIAVWRETLDTGFTASD